MILKSDAKFEKKLTCTLENDMRNLATFHRSTWKCQNWDFDEIFFSEVENVWAGNLQRKYLLWQWRTIQNLKRDWFFISKLAWEIWIILTRALELQISHFVPVSSKEFLDIQATIQCGFTMKRTRDHGLLN